MKTYYLTDVLDRYHRGWLEVKSEGGEKVLIPYSTKVNKLKVTDKCEVIKPLEGYFVNRKLIAPFLKKSDSDNYSFFTDRKIIFSKLHIRIEKRSNTLFLGKRSYPITLDGNLKKGIYSVRFPMRKNIKNTNYSDERMGGSRFFDIWFPIITKDEFNLSRFLHYGTYSKGCITVKHRVSKSNNWSDIFISIMHSRNNDQNLALIKIS